MIGGRSRRAYSDKCAQSWSKHGTWYVFRGNSLRANGDNEVQAALGVQRLGKAHLLEFLRSRAIEDLEQALTKLRESVATNHYDQQTQLLLARASALAEDDAGALKALKAAMRKSCDHSRTIASLEEFEAWVAGHAELRRLRATKPFTEFLQKLRASK